MVVHALFLVLLVAVDVGGESRGLDWFRRKTPPTEQSMTSIKDLERTVTRTMNHEGERRYNDDSIVYFDSEDHTDKTLRPQSPPLSPISISNPTRLQTQVPATSKPSPWPTSQPPPSPSATPTPKPSPHRTSQPSPFPSSAPTSPPLPTDFPSASPTLPLPSSFPSPSRSSSPSTFFQSIHPTGRPTVVASDEPTLSQAPTAPLYYVLQFANQGILLLTTLIFRTTPRSRVR